MQPVPVSWDTIKKIMKAIAERAARNAGGNNVSERQIKAAVAAVSDDISWVEALIGGKYDNAEEVMRAAINAAEQAETAPAAEPVAYRWTFNGEIWGYGSKRPDKFCLDVPVKIEPLYTHSTPSEARPTHRHKKRGTEYVLLCYGKMQAEAWKSPNPCGASVLPVDMREVAIYRSVDDGAIWVRPREEFEDGRFEALEIKPGSER